MKNSRQVAAEALLRVDTDESYSNIVLDRLLQSSGLSARDRAFSSALFYGVLEREITLDYVILQYASLPLGKMDPLVRQLLRLAVYQIAWMDGVPESAAVNESVQLAKRMGKERAAGFINGVLRSFLRDGGEIRLPEPGKDRAGWLSIQYSVPRPLIKLWQNQYPKEDLEQLIQGMTSPAPLFARVNTCRTSSEELCARLQTEGVAAQPHERFADCIRLEHAGSLEQLSAFQEGLFHIQDLSGQVCVSALDAKPGMRVLDCCAAPGGKSFTLAQRMQDKGEIVAGDLYSKKAELIRKGAARLGLSSIRAVTADASVYSPLLGQFDRVLCDAPCSGLGIIRRKPEIRYKNLDTLRELPAIQYKILSTAAQYVQEEGRLLYSTCTLNRHENDYIVQRFLNEHSDFSAAPLPEQAARFLGAPGASCVTLMPHRNGTDGFFLALFVRVKR
ncbi:MAG: 16S rRNA (cytosine(967)-C(5))-methyltransferase RsmB [Oscillospiraceae bacterium]|nr:16S rRNA (cytosine(967)-C(5))-methyltransferase RsmB [Oscillospiraceae bacterium]